MSANERKERKERKWAQKNANASPQKSAKERRRALTQERKSALLRKNCKQPGLKQPGLGTPNSQSLTRWESLKVNVWKHPASPYPPNLGVEDSSKSEDIWGQGLLPPFSGFPEVALRTLWKRAKKADKGRKRPILADFQEGRPAARHPSSPHLLHPHVRQPDQLVGRTVRKSLALEYFLLGHDSWHAYGTPNDLMLIEALVECLCGSSEQTQSS